MNLLVWLWVVPLAVILMGGALWAARFSPASTGWLANRGWGLTPRLEPAFGRISGCILVLAAGAGMTIAIVWPVGFGARNFNANDHAVYNWVLPRANVHWLHSTMRLLTEMSNNRQTQVVAAFAMAVLTVVWLFHRRGLAVFAPAVLILAAYEIEHQLQHTLKFLAARKGPVPADLGAFPSGGCARLISVYGLIIYLVLRRFGKTRSKIAVVAWTLLAGAAYTEGYSRLYLGKHWISDIFGGLVLGVVLLAVFIAATKMLDRPGRNEQEASDVSTHATFAGVSEPADRFATPTADPAVSASAEVEAQPPTDHEGR
jgi:membrane-associated phospholipid phosphatase